MVWVGSIIPENNFLLSHYLKTIFRVFLHEFKGQVVCFSKFERQTSFNVSSATHLFEHLSYNDNISMCVFSLSLFNEQHHLPLFIPFTPTVPSLSTSPYIPLTPYLLSPHCYTAHHELHFQLISTFFSLKHCKSYHNCHLPSK